MSERFRMALSILASLLTACASNEQATEVAPESPPQAPEPLGAIATAKRTVEMRNPFGNTAASDNLMVDGDFELTGLDRTATEPWRAFVKGVGQTIKMTTGGRCKSGVRCLVLTPGESAVGWMATPREGDIRVSLWARPNGGTCGALAVHVVDMNEPTKTKMIVPPSSPDESGACRFEGLAPSFPGGAPAVYLEIYPATKVTSVFVDDVVVLAATPSAKNVHPVVTSAPPAYLRASAEWLRRQRDLGDPERVDLRPRRERLAR